MQEPEEELDFQPEAIDPSEPSVVFDSSEVELADTAITWRWATATGDMMALRLFRFQSEMVAGKELFLPNQPSDQRVIAIFSESAPTSSQRRPINSLTRRPVHTATKTMLA